MGVGAKLAQWTIVPAAKTVKAGVTGGTVQRTAVWGGIGAGVGYATSDSESPTNRFLDTIRGATIGAGVSLGLKAGSMAAKASPGLVNAQGIKQAARNRKMHGLSRRAVKKGKASWIGPEGPRLPSGAFSRGEEQAMSVSYQFMQSPLAKGTRGLADMMATGGRFAVNHPYMLAGGALGGAAVMSYEGQGTGLHQSSPTLEGAEMNTRYDQQAIAAQELGQMGAGLRGSYPMMSGPWNRAMQQSTHGLVQGLHMGRHG
jgi:hypothetical protein